MGLIIDTSVFVAGERGRLQFREFCAAQGEDGLFVAAITASELLHGVERAPEGAIRTRRRRFVEDVLQDFAVLDFDLTVARHHSVIWAQLAKAGTPVGAHDLEIAATAVRHGFGLATLNTREFSRIPGLVLANMQPFLSGSPNP